MFVFENEKDCPVCGRHFVITGMAEEWVYKKNKSWKKHVSLYFCSWRCLREYERKHEAKRSKK